MSASTKRQKEPQKTIQQLEREKAEEPYSAYQHFVDGEIKKVEDNLNKFYAVHDKAATKAESRAVVNWAVGEAETLPKGITRLNTYLMNTYGANLEQGRERGRNDECVTNCRKINKTDQQKRSHCFRRCFQKRRWEDYFGNITNTITKKVFRKGRGLRRRGRRRSHRRHSKRSRRRGKRSRRRGKRSRRHSKRSRRRHT